MDNSKTRIKQVSDAGDITAEIERFVQALKRSHLHWKAAVAVGVVGTLGGVAAYKVVPTKWESNTVIVYREGISTSSNDRANDKLKTLSSTVKEILLSSTVLTPVVKEHKLYTEKWEGDDVTDAIDKMRDTVTFEKRAEDTFSITYVGDTADRAKEITEKLALYTGSEILRVYRQQEQSAAAFLSEEQKQRELDLKDLEGQQARFLVAHPEFAEDTKSGTNPGAAIRGAAKVEEEAAKAVSAAGSVVDKNLEKQLQSEKQMADQELAAARRVLDDKQRALATLREKYQDTWPEVKAALIEAQAAQAQVNQKQAASDEIARKVLLGATPAAATPKESDDPYVAAEKGRVIAPLAVAKVDAGAAASDDDVVAAETEWARITRDIAEQRKRLDAVRTDAFNAKLKRLRIEAGYADKFEVVNPAYVPTEPKQPAPMLVAGGVATFGWFLGACVAVALSVFDNRMFTRADLGRLVEVLAVVPAKQKPKRFRWARERLAAARAALAAPFRWAAALRRRARAQS
jgi:capsular polysaccharide biosynthesis protein